MGRIKKKFSQRGGRRGHIAQAVPTCTTRDTTLQVLKFVKCQLPMTDKCFIKQDNILLRITEDERGEGRDKAGD